MEGGRALERLMKLAVENEERRERKRREGGTGGAGEGEEEEEKEIDACGEGGEYHSMVSQGGGERRREKREAGRARASKMV